MLDPMEKCKSIQTDPVYLSTSENKLDSVEKLTDFFMRVYEKEMEVNNVTETTFTETYFSNLPSMSASKVIERCSYVYCHATCDTLLVKYCILRFLNEYSFSADLIDNWRTNLKISTLSSGPGVDSIAFNLAILEVSKDPTVVSNVCVISSSCEKWIRTIKILTQVFQEVKTPLDITYSKIKINLTTLFRPAKAPFVEFLQNSSVVLMFKTLNLDNLSEFLKTLKKGTLIFFINYPKQSSVMQSILNKTQGSFLYGPVTVASPEFIVEIPGKSTITVPSITYEFFVWANDFDPFASNKSDGKLLQPKRTFNVSALNASTDHEEPLKIVEVLKNNMKTVEMFYSYHSSQMQNYKGTQTDLVSYVVLENKLNTNRLMTDFFMEAFKREMALFRVKESIDLLNFPWLSSSNANFDDPKVRCAYMYYYATCYTLLMKECMIRFLMEYPNAQSLIAKWRSNPNHCSLSQGAGLDYIAFSLSVLKVSKQPTAVTDVQIVTAFKSWKSTINILSQVIQIIKTPLTLNFDKKFVQHQVLGTKWKAKSIKFLRTSSIVFMFNTLNLGEKETKEHPPAVLMDVVEFMSPGTVMFFMDSASSSSVMKMVLGCFKGAFLYGPKVVSSGELQIEVSEELLKSMQLVPAQNAEVEFFVWKKVSSGTIPFVCPQELNQHPLNLQILPSFSEVITPDHANLNSLLDCSFASDSKSPEKHIEAWAVNQFDTVHFLTLLFKKVYEKEISPYRANQSLPLSSVFELPSTLLASYNATCMRCAYVYQYATCHTLLIKYCISRFLAECSKGQELLRSWGSNSSYCSLSLGPGLDYLAFSLAVLEVTKKPIVISKVNVITKYIGWKNTLEILSDMVQEENTLSCLNFASHTILTGSVFEPWASKSIDCLLGASVLFMFKSLDLDEKNKKEHSSFIWELVNILSVGAVIFFIDSSCSSNIMQNALSKHHGTFLYGPISVAFPPTPVKIPPEIQKVTELLPTQSTVADFFVWQKNSNAPVFPGSLQNLKQNFDSLPIKSTSLTDCSFSKSEFHKGSESVLKSDENITSCHSGEDNSSNLPGSVTASSTLNRSESNIPSEMEPAKEILSDNQIDQIQSLIARINMLSSTIKTNFDAFNLLSMNDSSTNVTEINLLLKRINKLVTTLESNISKKRQSSNSRGHECNCYSSCKMHCFSCPNICDATSKSLSDSKPFVSSEETNSESDEKVIQLCNCQTVNQCLGHNNEVCCVSQPSTPYIVIPLENINPNMLSLLRSCTN